MARIETDEDDREKLRRELRHEIRGSVRRSMQRARWAPFCGCFFGMFLILIAVGGAALVLTAQSGLVRIPSLSERLYKPPEPLRVVGVVPPPKFEDILQNQISASLRQGEIPESARIALEEEELTAMLRESIATMTQNPDSQVQFSLIQAAAEKDFIELAARGNWQDRPLAIILRIVPAVSDGKLKFDILGAWLGRAPVHPKLLSPLKKRLEGALAEAMTADSEIKLESIELSSRIVYITLRLSR